MAEGNRNFHDFLSPNNIVCRSKAADGRELLVTLLDILKRRAGQRKATVYQSFSIPMGHPYPPLMPATPVVQDVGGVVVFVMDLQHMEKF